MKKKNSTVRSNDFSVSGVKINKNKKLFAAFVWGSYRIILNKQIVKKKLIATRAVAKNLDYFEVINSATKKIGYSLQKKKRRGRRGGHGVMCLARYRCTFCFRLPGIMKSASLNQKLIKNRIKWQMIGSNNNMAFCGGFNVAPSRVVMDE